MESWFWILGWILSILTIAGNGFIIFLVCNERQLRTKTNAFIVSLAVADFSVGASVVPFFFVCDMEGSCRDWPAPVPLCTYVIRWLFGYASVINLCGLVLERYIAVAKPDCYDQPPSYSNDHLFLGNPFSFCHRSAIHGYV